MKGYIIAIIAAIINFILLIVGIFLNHAAFVAMELIFVLVWLIMAWYFKQEDL